MKIFLEKGSRKYEIRKISGQCAWEKNFAWFSGNFYFVICGMNLQACGCDIQNIVFVYLCVGYLIELLITQIIECQIVES